MSDQRMIVIGTSAGGVDALMTIVRRLPVDFPAPICIVLHIPPDSPSLLAHILNREGPLASKEAEDGEYYRKGTIYVAPPDKHLLVTKDGRLRTVRGPRENRHRPSIDPLFRSAAAALGPDVIAVILTGALDDGTAGVVAVKKRGGIVIVQDPHDALYSAMPTSALEHVHADHVLPLADVARQLTLAVHEPRRALPEPVSDEEMLMEVRMAELDADALQDDSRPGEPSPYSCPDCGGVLWEIQDADLVRYRCRVGHAFSPETMLSAQSETLEEALWTAAKTLEESARLSKRLARSERVRGHEWLAKRFEDKEREARERVEVIRRFLLRSDSTVPVEVSEVGR